MNLWDYNIKIPGYEIPAIVISENTYKNVLKGHEQSLDNNCKNDYVLVLHEGLFNFYHYSEKDFKEVKPSVYGITSWNLSFGSGIYCYNADTHIPAKVDNSFHLYKGIYNGKYLECIRDSDPQDDFNNKGEGNRKEYVLLTNKSVPVSKIF